MGRARWFLAGGLLTFGLVLGLMLADVTTSVDETVSRDMTTWSATSSSRITVLRWLTALGSSRWLWPVGAAVVLGLAATRRLRSAGWLAVTMLAGSGLNALVKALTDRDRPTASLVETQGLSFPSGHTMGSMVVYGAILIAVWPLLSEGARRALLVAVAVLVATIGFTRIALGVHFLTDVVGAFALGAAWLGAAEIVRSRWVREGLPDG